MYSIKDYLDKTPLHNHLSQLVYQYMTNKNHPYTTSLADLENLSAFVKIHQKMLASTPSVKHSALNAQIQELLPAKTRKLKSQASYLQDFLSDSALLEQVGFSFGEQATFLI